MQAQAKVLKDGKRVRFIEWSREGLRFEGWLCLAINILYLHKGS